MYIRIFSSLIFIGCLLFSCSPDVITNSDDLTKKLTSIHKKSDFPGFAVTVIRKNQIAYQQTFGVANMAQNVAYTNQTTQPIASISKLFVGVALMKAVEKGLLTLETDINTILPFRVVNPNAPTVPIRVKHLVTHTSGILDNEPIRLSLYSILPGELLTTAEAKRMQSQLKARTNGELMPLGELMAAYLTTGGSLYSPDNFAKSAPGATYNYGNIASSLAAYVVERVAGKPFAEFTKTEIFVPLGLKNTAWMSDQLPQQQTATLYWAKDKPLPRYVHSSFPDGKLNTSNEDLGLFLQAMMQGYAGQPGILTKASFQTLFARRFTDLPANMNPKEDNYGVFWVWFKNGRIGHTGGDLGVTTLLAFYPDKQTGFTFMTNLELENSDNLDKLNNQFQQVVNAIKEFEALN
jgi:CubicO group peptidase (beta-lactamase class C family)